MSEYVSESVEPLPTPTPVESVEPEEPIAEVAVEEKAEVDDVEEEAVEEESVEEEAVEEVAVEPEESVEEVAVAEVAVEEEAEVAVEAAPAEQIVSDIRDILKPVEPSPIVDTDTICSLKTLVNVLGGWSSGQVRRRNVVTLLEEGTDVDENLDNVEKVVELFKIWVKEGTVYANRTHNDFLYIDDYTLTDESRDLSAEKKREILKSLIELTINTSHRRLTREKILDFLDDLY